MRHACVCVHVCVNIYTHTHTLYIWSLCLVLSFACESLVAPALFVEEVVFAPLYCLCFFASDQLIIFMRFYFWILSYVLLMYLSVLLPVPHCLDCHSFIVGLKVE